METGGKGGGQGKFVSGRGGRGRGQVKCVIVRVGNVGGKKSCCKRKGGKHPRFIWRGNYGVRWKS